MTHEDITPEVYAAHIPGCCRLRTFEEHVDIMLCWGLVNQIREGYDTKACGMCEFNAEPAGDFARIEWHEQQQKQRVWRILSGTK